MHDATDKQIWQDIFLIFRFSVAHLGKVYGEEAIGAFWTGDFLKFNNIEVKVQKSEIAQRWNP